MFRAIVRPALLLCTALLTAAACTPLSARALVQLDVVDRDGGQWLPKYRHRGQDWIAGVPGHRYAVRLANTTGERLLVVLSVDGVNAVTGETANPGQTGYVLAPWQTAEITGWRKSRDDVAQFVFTDLADSYAARTGRPDDVGVIGIAVFRERRWPETRPAVPPPIARDGARDEAGARRAAPAAAAETGVADVAPDDFARQRIGTGHGAREWSPVAGTTFERASRSPAQVVQLRYDDVHALATLGVLPRPVPGWTRRPPRAFPEGFVADPPRR